MGKTGEMGIVIAENGEKRLKNEGAVIKRQTETTVKGDQFMEEKKRKKAHREALEEPSRLARWTCLRVRHCHKKRPETTREQKANGKPHACTKRQ